MIRFRETRVAGCVAVLLLFSSYVAPAFGAAMTSRMVATKTVIVMPFQTPQDCPIATLGDDVARSITTGIGASSSVRAILLTDRLPSIRRAMNVDKTIKKEDLSGPFGTEKDQIQAALKIARETGADYMLVGSIDEAKVDKDAKKADVTLTVSMVDITTGEAVKTEVRNGQSAENSSAKTDVGLLSEAAGDAVAKIVANMVLPSQAAVMAVSQNTPAVHRSGKNHKTWIIGLAVAAAVGIVALSHNGGSSGSGIDNPPAPP